MDKYFQSEIVRSSTGIGQCNTVIDKTLRIAVTADEKGSYSLIYKVHDTSVLQKRINDVSEQYEDRISVLRQVILVQRKLIEYNGIYNAFLLGSISESELYEEAERYSYEPINIPPQELSKKIKYLQTDTHLEFTVLELKELFQCQMSSIEGAIGLLEANNVSKVSHVNT